MIQCAKTCIQIKILVVVQKIYKNNILLILANSSADIGKFKLSSYVFSYHGARSWQILEYITREVVELLGAQTNLRNWTETFYQLLN